MSARGNPKIWPRCGPTFEPAAPLKGQAEAGIAPWVSSVGDSHDDALAETIDGRYKATLIHRRRLWRSFDAVELAALEWVDWFNHQRLLAPFSDTPLSQAGGSSDRIVTTEVPSVISAYEERIQNGVGPITSFEETLRTALDFLASS